MRYTFIKLIASLIFFASPLAGHAATLSFEPAAGVAGPGDTMAVDVLIDVMECVNAIEAEISFPKDYMQFKDFILSESVLSLWIEKPDKADLAEVNGNGIIKFAGGVPGGYCGRIAGDQGDTRRIARLVFDVPSLIVAEDERASLDLSFLSSTKVLLNDGFGTADALTARGASYIFSPKGEGQDDSWRREIIEDNIPPEPFVIELLRKKDVFDNQYFIAFQTQDKQSGMDHYEVLELGREDELGVTRQQGLWEKLFGEEKKPIGWQRAEMPYLLIDQSLRSVIKVKAIDKAGNERFVEYVPQGLPEVEQKTDNNMLIWLIAGLSFLLLSATIVIMVIRIKKKKNEEQYDKE